MIHLEEHLRGTASAITTDICLTKDRNKNIIGDSITASNWEIVSKNISQSKEKFKKFFWSVYKFWSVDYKN